jgi:hypothetical protein
MKLTVYLKKQLNDFVEVYEKYLVRTSGITLALTLICFVIIALLLRFSEFSPSATSKQFSLLSYFFYRYSLGDIYSIVDLSKTVLIFFVSIFSLGLTRINMGDKESTELKIGDFFRQIFPRDLLYLSGVLVLCSIIDYGLFKLDMLIWSNINLGLDYFHGLLFLCRVYIPLVLFGLIIYMLGNNRKPYIDLKKIFFFVISLWLFNEFAYEFSIIVRNQLLGFVLLPINSEKHFFIESFMGIFLIAFYFVGYHSAMSTSLKFLNEKD